ncbi:DUF1501 domain-containing protein [Variovorax arabinosiphilus]|uniref:DUF1501 domain-containing protein n=1 Tax=Variovorax arabinosiphilus TaxID=3053498 RepID=UPI00257498F8|nr:MULTISPECIES: DUF1501 domain-containing protein [unclassified Variovorax]MDM0121863.1 DUF1501 domain-containing protein [Variovorax sp. J2L1-78]MDM0131607.1 DUF1501 domain-containing protein [Variovorax sp. J2L1-63]MDM0234626.1 DUF1501 domain-containing protein [Variovorax sp. J2R1-6]
MHFIDPQGHTRRAFLRRSGQLAMAGTALPFALNLAAMGEAAAQSATDYKALVCVFLYGGNDYANTVVTYDDPSYLAYSQIRGGNGLAGGGVAIPKAALTPTLLSPTTALPDGRQYALHPAMTQLANLYNTDGKVAVQLNVGPLVVPLTRAQYQGSDRRNYPVPPKLFSHNDQQSTWQSSSPEGSTVGWGGNLGDLAMTQNGNSLFTCMSVSGNAVFLSGDNALQYQVSTNGAIPINSVKSNVYGSSSVKAAMTQLVQQTRGHTLENEYNRITVRAVQAEGQVNSASGIAYPNGEPGVAGTFPYNVTTGGVPYNGNGLASQLAMVARLIRGRSTLGAKRQVFFVSMGGFDLHDNLIANQPGLMARLSDAMAAFHKEMVALGLGNNVTSFTASDFGRTLASNGDGSDHGWGGHHLVVGGAVKGKDKLYGKAPVVSINNDSKLAGYEGHVGQGRLIPGTSVDQYAGTLAKWFGVPAADLGSILPNLKNFGSADYPTDLGFMA